MKSRLSTMIALLLVLASGPAPAETVFIGKIDAMRSDLDRLASSARASGTGTRSVFSLMIGWLANLRSGPSEVTKDYPQVTRNMPRGKLGTIPLGLALVHLNSVSGNSVTSLSKLGHSAPVLVIREGRLTLTQLLQDAATQFPDAIVGSSTGAIAAWPLFIWSDAELALESGDHLVLSGRTGSFILNAGVLQAEKASLSIDSGAPANFPEFRPFIATVLSGAMQARGSEFTGFGFADSPAASGVVIAGSPLSLKTANTVLADNTFRDLGSVAIRNSIGIQISGNRFVASRFSNLRLDDVSSSYVIRNVFVGTQGAFSIGIGSNSYDVDVSSNVVLSGKGAGIRVEKGALSVKVAGNLVSDQSEDGIVIDRASCVDIQRNFAFGNHSNGISVSHSSGISLTGNQLLHNGRAGVFVHAQAKDAVTIVESNSFVENASGIRGQGSSHIEIAGNDLSGQLPILVSGDLSSSLNQFLDHQRQGGRSVLAAAAWASPTGEEPQSLIQTRPTIPCRNGS
jgi:hypothetical protein